MDITYFVRMMDDPFNVKGATHCSGGGVESARAQSDEPTAGVVPVS